MIVERHTQKITSGYGKRNGFKRFHRGVDLRCYDDAFSQKLPVLLPERAQFLRKVYQKKWGWTYVFKPLDSDYAELKFTHMAETNMIEGEIYLKDTYIGFTMVTEYMRKKGYAEHLHFETWIKKPGSIHLTHSNPVIYMDIMGIPFI